MKSVGASAADVRTEHHASAYLPRCYHIRTIHARRSIHLIEDDEGVGFIPQQPVMHTHGTRM